MSEFNFDKIPGTLVYVQIQEPAKAYVKPGAEPKSDEWKSSVVITDEDMVDALEDYARTLDTKLSLKKVKTLEFKDKYKIDAPEGAGKNVWVLTLRKSTTLGKTGKPVPDMYKPKVFQKMGAKLVDITHSKLVGNGSIGVISVDRFDRQAGGSSLYLKNVLVTELVEYTKAEVEYEAGSEFEDAPQPKVATKTEVKANPKPATTEDDDFPF